MRIKITCIKYSETNRAVSMVGFSLKKGWVNTITMENSVKQKEDQFPEFIFRKYFSFVPNCVLQEYRYSR